MFSCRQSVKIFRFQCYDDASRFCKVLILIHQNSINSDSGKPSECLTVSCRALESERECRIAAVLFPALFLAGHIIVAEE